MPTSTMLPHADTLTANPKLTCPLVEGTDFAKKPRNLWTTTIAATTKTAKATMTKKKAEAPAKTAEATMTRKKAKALATKKKAEAAGTIEKAKLTMATKQLEVEELSSDVDENK